MKTRSLVTRFALTMLIVLIALNLSAQSKTDKPARTPKNPKARIINLFNGKDLSNWAFHLRDASADPVKVFTVQNGVIHIKGDPFGYMRTKDVYSDYSLHLEWRYPGELSNSGVFIHAQLPDTIWLKCFECQLKAGSAGDFVCMNGSDMIERRINRTGSLKKWQNQTKSRQVNGTPWKSSVKQVQSRSLLTVSCRIKQLEYQTAWDIYAFRAKVRKSNSEISLLQSLRNKRPEPV